MKKVFSENCTIPIKMWLDDLEDNALSQAKNLANLPFAFKHIALMPDSHTGYGMPIGGVLATKGVVIPNAVGVDIGCGMCAIKTSLEQIDRASIIALLKEFRASIPIGFDHHQDPQDESLMPPLDAVPEYGVVRRQYKAALKQIGTLGGGNHFIEIQQGSDGHIWVMIHSGSRNFGLQVATHYNNVAKQLNAKWHTTVDPKHDLAFLPIEEPIAKDYMAEMRYCVDFAFANRKLMMHNVQQSFEKVCGGGFSVLEFINIAHNYAQWENHFNANVLIHRKGATSARAGEIGIIPGSQGTKSYIVEGKGNVDSFQSCSHGAGRAMGRKQAQRELDLEHEKSKLDERGIIHAIRSKTDLDEAPGAYKNIDTVMQNQSDLVEIKVELSPLAVIKG